MASLIPTNTASFNLEEVLASTGGDLVSGTCTRFVGVCTDTRTCAKGSLFVALAGENFDGHRFVAEAAKAGAAMVLVEKEVEAVPGVVVVRVGCTLEALGRLGAWHRKRWGGAILAVAGSVGKTTTRSALAALLKATGCEVHCPAGNLNNRVGVPLVLLGLLPTHGVGVVELGTSLPGEVAQLVELAQPDIAILTRISIEHSEGLGGIDAIEREEGAVLRGLSSTALAVVNADDDRCLRQLATREKGRDSVLYGTKQFAAAGVSPSERVGPGGLRYWIDACEVTGPATTRVRIRRSDGTQVDAESPLLGAPGAYALTAALAATEAFLKRPVVLAEMNNALASSELGEPGRLCPVLLADGSLLLDDTYNSSPASVISSVTVARGLAQKRGARLILVLGEMRELGSDSRVLHEQLGEDLVEYSPSSVVAFGGDARHLVSGALGESTPCAFEEKVSEVAATVLHGHRASDVILVKSSRGLRAEKIVQTIADQLGKQS